MFCDLRLLLSLSVFLHYYTSHHFSFTPDNKEMVMFLTMKGQACYKCPFRGNSPFFFPCTFCFSLLEDPVIFDQRTDILGCPVRRAR
jgi:hypothetical protein